VRKERLQLPHPDDGQGFALTRCPR
jgi:hypothetical protein